MRLGAALVGVTLAGCVAALPSGVLPCGDAGSGSDGGLCGGGFSCVNGFCTAANGGGSTGGTSGGGCPDGGEILVDAGGLEVSVPLEISPTTLYLGQTVYGTATLCNPSSTAITLTAADIAGRPPGGAVLGGPYDDLLEQNGPIGIAPGQSYVLSGSRTITSAKPTGSWFAYVAVAVGDPAEYSNSIDHVAFTVLDAGLSATTGASSSGTGTSSSDSTGSTTGATSVGTTSSGGTFGGSSSSSGGSSTGGLGAGLTVSTFATSASFLNPAGIAIDSAGNLIVADASLEEILKLTPAGAASTLAGNGTKGYVNGPGSTAEFDRPSKVALDAAGNVYVADSDNNRIRRIDDGGNVSTFAGNGDAGYSNGDGGTAAFNFPIGVALDDGGNLFVADERDDRIREISAETAVVTTYAGNGINGTGTGDAGTGEFQLPQGLVIDSAGNVYVSSGNQIRIIREGLVSVFAGNNLAGLKDGDAGEAEFNQPDGLAIDGSGNILVADSLNNAIRKIDPSGHVTTLAGNGDAGYLDSDAGLALFNDPTAVAVDAAGNIYVADYYNRRVRVIRP